MNTIRPLVILLALAVFFATAVHAQPPGVAWVVGGHDGKVLSIAESYDGAYVASGASDGLVRLWDRRTGHLVRTYDEQKTAAASGDPSVNAVAFSPDGRLIASGGRGGRIIIWELAGGRVVGRHAQASYVTRGMVFTPDGRRVVAGNRDGTLGYWDIDTGLVRMVPAHASWIDHFAVSPDGATIATASIQVDSIRLWDCATGQPRGAFMPSANVGRIAFATNGRLVASYPDSLYVWDIAARAVVAALPPVGAGRLACSTTGDTLAISRADSIFLAGTTTGAFIRTIARYANDRAVVPQIQFLRDGTGLLSGAEWYANSGDALLRIHGFDGGAYTRDFIATTTAPVSCAFTVDSRVVAFTDGRGHLMAYTADSGMQTLNYRPRARAVSAAVSAHAEYAVVDTAANTGATTSGYMVVPLADTSAVRASRRTTRFSSAPAVAPGGNYIIVPGTIGFLFDIEKGTDTVFANNFGGFTFSGDGHLLAGFESVTYTARVWEFPSLRPLDTLKLGFSFVHAFSSDGKLIAVALSGDTIAIWDVAARTVVRRIAGKWGGTTAIAFSEDSRYVVAGCGDSLVRVFSIATAESVHAYDDIHSPVTRLVVSPDGARIAAATQAPSLVMLRAPAALAASVDDRDVADADPICVAEPNPFAGATTIRFRLPSPAAVTLAVYSASGRREMVLTGGVLDAGEHAVRLDASGLSSGVHFVRLASGSRTRTIAVVHVH